jgi:predicted amidohydrolase YtcJ
MPPEYAYGNDNTEVFLPDERLDLETSIAGFTINAAFVNHLDDITGSIETGKLADLAILDRDPFAFPSEEISAATVEATFVGGVKVFERISG